MDWFSWLSRTALDPSLVYEYGLAFARNELEEDDISFFNHEFLQSMGISIAKHRLEILKLARKERGKTPPAMAKLLVAIKRTRRSLARYIKTWIPCEESALVVVPRSRNSKYASRWKGGMLRRNKKQGVAKPERLLLTNGSPLKLPGPSRISDLPSPYELRKAEREVEEGDGYWSSAWEDRRWDSMFRDLNPT